MAVVCLVLVWVLNLRPLKAETSLEEIGKTFGERFMSRNIIRGLFEQKGRSQKTGALQQGRIKFKP